MGRRREALAKSDRQEDSGGAEICFSDFAGRKRRMRAAARLENFKCDFQFLVSERNAN